MICISTKISADFLKHFFKDPVQSFNNYSKIMDKSPVTIKNYYEKLKSSLYVNNEMFVSDKILGTRIISIVQAELDHQNLGLSYVLLHLKNMHPYSKMEQILRILENFPFVYKISKIKAPTFDLLVLFAIPIGSLTLIENIAKITVFSNICKSYKICVINDTVSSKLDISNWDEETNTWRLPRPDGINQGLNFLKYFENVFLKYYGQTKQRLTRKSKIELKKIDKLDILMLRELEYDGRISLSKLVGTYSKDNSYLSRKTKKLRDHHIRSYNVNLSNDQFNISDCTLIGKAEQSVIDALYECIRDSSLFIGNKFYTCENREFYWEIQIPTIFIDDFLNFLSSFCDQLSYYQIDNQDLYQQKIDPQYFDFKSQKWVIDNDSLFNHYTTTIANRSLIRSTYQLGNMSNSDLSKFIDRFISNIDVLVNEDLKPLLSFLQSEQTNQHNLFSITTKDIISSIIRGDNSNIDTITSWLNIILIHEDPESEFYSNVEYFKNSLKNLL